MKTPDQLAAEVADRIDAGVESYNFPSLKSHGKEFVTQEVKAAIEEAIGSIGQPDRNETESRTAQASELSVPIDLSDPKQAAEVERRLAAQASEPTVTVPFDQSKHHASCTLNDQEPMWVCAQCGHKEPAVQ